MTKDRNDLKAGIFIAISIALIVAVIIGIKGIGRIIEPSQTPLVTFKLTDDLGGLRAGDDVRIGGFKVGVIRDIELRQETGAEPHLLVSCSVPSRFVIKTDARISVQNTLTGTSWLNFDSLGSAGAQALPAGATLSGHPSPMTTFFAGIGDIIPEVKATVSDVRGVTVPKANTAIDTARDALVNIRDIFGETKGDFKSTMASLSAATGSVKEKLPGILDKVDGVMTQITSAVEKTSAALDDIKKVAADAREVSGEAKSILVSNRGKIDDMVTSLKKTGDNLEFATQEIRRSPWRLLYKPKPGEVANLNLYDAARQFAGGANDLNDAAGALRDALRDPNVKEERLRALVENLDKTFANFTEIEHELWKQVK